MRRPRITAAHLAAATAALAVTTAFTAWSTANAHRTVSGAWNGPIAVGWLLLVVSGLWFLVLGCYGLYRLVRWLWAPSVRPAPGTGSRAPSLTRRQWWEIDEGYRNWRIANAAAGPATLEQPVAVDDTQMMSPIDLIDEGGLKPDRVVRADAAELPPSQGTYVEVTTHLQTVADGLSEPAAWDLFPWEAAA